MKKPKRRTAGISLAHGRKMMIPPLFSDTMILLEKVMDLRGRKHEILVSNITNQDTPGYEAKDLRFEDMLKAAFQEKQKKGLIGTDGRHLAGGDNPLGSVLGEVVVRNNTAGFDANRVHVEQEMAQMAENSMMYNTSAQILSAKFQALLYAIREAR
jgi:flagellar basal-body rod protein FlgB